MYTLHKIRIKNKFNFPTRNMNEFYSVRKKKGLK